LRPISTSFYEDIEATVKFFDPAKGYGFVAVSDGSPDAFLPAAVMMQAGHRSFHPGTVIFCAIAPGAKGPEITAIHYVDVAISAHEQRAMGAQATVNKPRPQTSHQGKERRVI